VDYVFHPATVCMIIACNEQVEFLKHLKCKMKLNSSNTTFVSVWIYRLSLQWYPD
jgi:hypothetical protein